MKIDELRQQLGFTVISGCENCDIRQAYTSDLLSDVMGNAPDDSVLITIQAHKNTVAVAGLAGIKAVILCNGRKAPEDMIPAAQKEGIALLGTSMNQFEASIAVGRALGLCS